jgi:hypothetical protein
MARPKKEEAQTEVPATIDEALVEAQKPKRVLVKSFQFVTGYDAIGSKMSMQASKTLELEFTPYGIKGFSKNSNRTIFIPWTNIKGAELLS